MNVCKKVQNIIFSWYLGIMIGKYPTYFAGQNKSAFQSRSEIQQGLYTFEHMEYRWSILNEYKYFSICGRANPQYISVWISTDTAASWYNNKNFYSSTSYTNQLLYVIIYIAKNYCARKYVLLSCMFISGYQHLPDQSRNYNFVISSRSIGSTDGYIITVWSSIHNCCLFRGIYSHRVSTEGKKALDEYTPF